MLKVDLQLYKLKLKDMNYLDRERFVMEAPAVSNDVVFIITDGYRELAREFHQDDAESTFSKIDSDTGMTLGYINESDIDEMNWNYTMSLLNIIDKK